MNQNNTCHAELDSVSLSFEIFQGVTSKGLVKYSHFKIPAIEGMTDEKYTL